MNRTLLVALIGTTVAIPGTVSAQDTPPTPPPERTAVELVLRREAFTYPTIQRRNPFVPLTSAAESGPRFGQMTLIGILFDEINPERSMAVVSAGGSQGGAPAGGALGAAAQDQARGEVQRLNVGERWGDVRVVSIQKDAVVVTVSNFGIEEQRIMRVQSRGQGGS